jgi:hypothetical protein
LDSLNLLPTADKNKSKLEHGFKASWEVLENHPGHWSPGDNWCVQVPGLCEALENTGDFGVRFLNIEPLNLSLLVLTVTFTLMSQSHQKRNKLHNLLIHG